MHLIIIRELNITNRGYKAQKCYHLKNKLVSENILEVYYLAHAGIVSTFLIVSIRIL